MLDSDMLSRLAELTSKDTKLEEDLHAIDRQLLNGSYHLKMMQTYKKGSKEWISFLRNACSAFRGTVSLMETLYARLEDE